MMPSHPPNPVILQHPKAPETKYFLEYEQRNNSHHAYLFPCNEEGVVSKEEISNPDQFFSVSSSPKFRVAQIVSIDTGMKPLIFVCTCRNIIILSNWNTLNKRCPKCKTLWESVNVLTIGIEPDELEVINPP